MPQGKCIGGPLDGQRKAYQGRFFEVFDLAEPVPIITISPTEAECDITKIKTHRYDWHGAYWQYRP